MKAALGWLMNARLEIAWQVIGVAMDCYACARQCIMLRTQFDDRPMTSHQPVQNYLAWMIAGINKMQFIPLHSPRLKDQGRLHHSHVSMVRRNYAAMALEVARRPCYLLGANGTTDEYPLFRRICNLEVKTYEGTHNIDTWILAAEATEI